MREADAAYCASCVNVHGNPIPVKFTTSGIIRGVRIGKPCNAACANSRTSRCSCSCGGANHGIVHQYHGRAVEAVQRMEAEDQEGATR